MKISYYTPFILFIFVLTLFSCRTEDDLTIDPPIDETITANSTIAILISRTTANDGSFDNIIDQASCLSIQLPVTVVVNGLEIVINDDDGYEEVEDILDLFDDDIDTVAISYPITVIFVDFTTQVVNSDEELAALASNCSDENEDDDDIECIDFQYPITASVFDQNNELIQTITISNDNEMYDFIDDLEDFAAVTISFPITVILADGNTQTINSIQELEDVIEAADNSCDEDDDNDYNDDDCDSCSTDVIASLFNSCTSWTVDKLERNDEDLEDNYENYTFTFNLDGTIDVDDGGNGFNGSWTATGTANNIDFEINITGLNDFNDTWNLHEIEQESDEAQFDLRLGDDRLKFESDCEASDDGGGDDDDVSAILTDGLWFVASYLDDGDDETSDYTNYEINFDNNGSVIASNGSSTNTGTWSVFNNDTQMAMDFGSDMPFEEFNDDDWNIIAFTSTSITLQDVSGGGGGTDTLVLEKL